MIKKKKKERRIRMKKIGRLGVILFLVLSSNMVLAADVKIEAQVDRDQMGIGDSFTLNISVQSDEDFELSNLQAPKVSGLEVIDSIPGGRQSSSSMTIVNGKTQFIHRTIQDFNIVMSPQKEGTFLIPGVDVNVGGQSYKSNPIKIEVKEEFRNAKMKKPKGRPQFPPGYGASGEEEAQEPHPFGSLQDDEDLFDQLLKQQQRLFGRGSGTLGGRRSAPVEPPPTRQMNINPNDAFFVHLELDKTTAFEGEQVTARWYIYTRSNIETLDRVKFPDLKGFWKEIIEEVPALQFTEEIVNGARYKKALLASHALFPIKSGKAVIDEFRIKARVRTLTQFGWGNAYEFTKNSKRTEIKVLPLPQEGRTKSFSGAVGSYRVSVKTDATTFPSHQPFSIKIRYEGIGNAKLVDLPAINWPDGLEIYDTKSESKFFKDGQSYKEFEILAIPRKEGELKIPSLELTYFDPQMQKYVSDQTREQILQITKGNLSDVRINKGNNTQNTAAEAAFSPQPILEFPSASLSIAAHRWSIYLTILFLGFFGLLVNFLIQIKNLRLQPQLLIEVKSKLGLLEKYFDANDHRKIGSEATNLIYILVANLAGQKRADQEIHLLINEIPTKDQQQFLERIMQLFDYFQLIGFSPEEIKNETLSKEPLRDQIGQLKNLAEEIVDKLRKQDKNNM